MTLLKQIFNNITQIDFDHVLVHAQIKEIIMKSQLLLYTYSYSSYPFTYI